jgi:hypothetical protein
MDLDTLNAYLEKLHGVGNIVSLDTEADVLIVKFCGSVGGPYDDGEIELTFLGVEAIHLPMSMILPVQMRRAEDSETVALLGANYLWNDRSLWILTDSVDSRWHVYSAEYSVKVLPVFWQSP